MFNGLGLLFILLWLWLLRSSKVHAKRNYLFEKLLRLIRSSAVMHKTDESEWNKSKKGRRVVSWKSSLVDHQNLAAFRMLCIFRGKKQKWPRFLWNVLSLEMISGFKYVLQISMLIVWGTLSRHHWTRSAILDTSSSWDMCVIKISGAVWQNFAVNL